MTDNEIIKALNGADGLGHISIYCADNNGEDVTSIKIVDIIDLINRLEKGNEKNENIIRLADKTIEKQSAEIERLQKAGEEAVSCFNRMESLYKIKCVEIDEMRRRKNATIERLKDKLFLALHTDTAKRNIESEAIKEFAERLNARIRKDIDEQGMLPLPYTKKAYDTVRVFIDNLVKEMTEVQEC